MVREGGILRIKRIDHFVLTVKDIEKTCDFYTSVLGMEKIIFADNRTALSFGSQKINLHKLGKEYEPKANTPTSGSSDFCLITDMPIDKVIKHLESCRVEILEGPVNKVGASGKLLSIYIRDPDLNLVEISNYI